MHEPNPTQHKLKQARDRTLKLHVPAAEEAVGLSGIAGIACGVDELAHPAGHLLVEAAARGLQEGVEAVCACD